MDFDLRFTCPIKHQSRLVQSRVFPIHKKEGKNDYNGITITNREISTSFERYIYCRVHVLKDDWSRLTDTKLQNQVIAQYSLVDRCNNLSRRHMISTYLLSTVTTQYRIVISFSIRFTWDTGYILDDLETFDVQFLFACSECAKKSRRKNNLTNKLTKMKSNHEFISNQMPSFD